MTFESEPGCAPELLRTYRRLEDLLPLNGLEPRTLQPYSSHCTTTATPAQIFRIEDKLKIYLAKSKELHDWLLCSNEDKFAPQNLHQI
jgi:hypothetical protein